jgi:hypothetical protein
MHGNFVLYLFSPSSDEHRSTRTWLQSLGVCLRRFFRRFCFCFVLCIWSLSMTATIPLLYTIDSNEKIPKPVYCPGTTQISYLDEWFDRNRATQTIIFNLIPLLISLFLTLIALSKLFYDSLVYLYLRLKMSKCSPCRKQSSDEQPLSRTAIPKSVSMLSSFGSSLKSTPTSEIHISSTIQSCRQCCSTSFLRFLLILSCCLLACIYPIAMRFYLVYFSVLVPLIFAVVNYSLGQLTVQQQTVVENRNMNMTSPPVLMSLSDTQNIGKSSEKREQNNSSNEQFELRSPLLANLLNERDEFVVTPSSSSQSSTTSPSNYHRLRIGKHKQKYFSNHLYENTRNIFMK